jgi:hypothetical protein
MATVLPGMAKKSREQPQHRFGSLYKLPDNAKRRGSSRYAGVHGNSPSLQPFFNRARQLLCKWVNRRSQGRSYTWTGFTELLRHVRVERPLWRPRPDSGSESA